MKEEELIFLISQPRSGSTFLQRILSNNDFVNTTSEHWLLLNYSQFLKPDIIRGSFNNELANEALSVYYDRIDRNKIEQDFKNFILNQYSPLLVQHQFVLDKTPRYWEICQEILQLFPKSKFIILTRNPIDVAISIIKTWQLRSIYDINNYRRDLLLAPKFLDAFLNKNKPKKNIKLVRYEDLLNNPESEITDLLKWLQLSIDAKSILDIKKNNKHLGKFGDPFQNANFFDNINPNMLAEEELNAMHKNFLEGYGHFIKSMNLSNYENYFLPKTQETSVFNDFLLLGDYFERNREDIIKIKSIESELKYANIKLTSYENSMCKRLMKFYNLLTGALNIFKRPNYN